MSGLRVLNCHYFPKNSNIVVAKTADLHEKSIYNLKGITVIIPTCRYHHCITKFRVKVFHELLPVVVLVTNSEDVPACPGPGFSLYKNGEGLTEFPPNVDSCHTINLNNNSITSLKGASASKCETLDISNNRIANLPADLLKWFPNLVFLNVGGNPIVHIDREIFNSTLEIIIPCNCALKIASNGVRIRAQLRCSLGKTVKESLEELKCQVKEPNGKSLLLHEQSVEIHVHLRFSG